MIELQLAPSCPSDDSLQLQKYLETLEEEGGTIWYEVDADGNVLVYVTVTSSVITRPLAGTFS